MDSFYVHLQSDASWRHYSDNTRTNYRNHLAIPINVESSQYEVALSELSYTYNNPYIKEGAKLYKVYKNGLKDTKGLDVVNYPGLINITNGANQVDSSRVVNNAVLEYAKKHNMHVPAVEMLFKNPIYKTDNQEYILIESRMDILATKNIKSTKELAENLNSSLKRLKFEVSYREETKAFEDKPLELKKIKHVQIIQKNPPTIAKQLLEFYPPLEKHLQIDVEEHEYFYNKSSKFHEFNTIALNEALNIKTGDLLCAVYFYKAEIALKPTNQKGNEKISKYLRINSTTTESVHSLEQLVRVLNAVDTGIQFRIENDRCKINIKLSFDGKIDINERVQAILGLDVDPEKVYMSNLQVTVEGTQKPIFDVGSRKIYVYADCIQDQRVGDQMAPILRILDYTGTNNNLVIKSFNNPHYINLSKDYVDNIRVYLRTEIGENLPLVFGTTSCTLHIREKRL